jgi:hypothetical protein
MYVQEQSGLDRPGGGRLFGWAAASLNLGLFRCAGAEEKKEPIEFVVRLPADATLDVDDHRTQETGPVRTFITPPLSAEGHYTYVLKAVSRARR